MGIMWDINIKGAKPTSSTVVTELEYIIRASSISTTFTYTYPIPLIGKPIIIGG